MNQKPGAVSLFSESAGQLLLVAMLGSEPGGVGSIPTPAALLSEVIRPDEEAVLKTAGELHSLVSSSLTASAVRILRPWCNGSITGSNPVGQGSSPWGRAGENFIPAEGICRQKTGGIERSARTYRSEYLPIPMMVRRQSDPTVL